MINSTDPDGMLQWFTEKLLDAEKKGMKVHVLGHISPGDAADCTNVWSANYKKIALRYISSHIGHPRVVFFYVAVSVVSCYFTDSLL